MTIQWFPGHMAKTRRLMTENLKLVDVVVEIVDARLPKSSRNPLIHDLVGTKPRVLVMAKADLAEEKHSKAWVAWFRRQGLTAMVCDLKGANSKSEVKAVISTLRSQAANILASRQNRGINDQAVRVMATGIPNVGKSTMINLLAGRAMTETADRPGVTKGKQWIRLANDVELLDMPGILWPNLEDREGARKLAATGAIGDNAYDSYELALWLIRWLAQNRPGRLTQRYGVDESDAFSESLSVDVLYGKDMAESAEETDELALSILEAIGKRRGLLRKGGIVETDKAAIILLDEFRGGKLGGVTMDEPPEEDIPS